MMEEHKHQGMLNNVTQRLLKQNMYSSVHSLHSWSCLDLRQLRSDTSLELGCDARGHSRAGSDTTIWYCVVVAGRPGVALSKKRQVSFNS